MYNNIAQPRWFSELKSYISCDHEKTYCMVLIVRGHQHSTRDYVNLTHATIIHNNNPHARVLT